MAPDDATPTRTQRLAGAALARYIRLVRNTSRLQVEPRDGVQRFQAAGPAIVAFWHGQFMLVPSVAPPVSNGIDVMVARHGDAEVIGQALSHFDGLSLIRGAGAGERKKDRGGRAAVRAALKALRNGAMVAMTADVPPGPARRAGAGIVTIARMSGCPIIPIAIASSRFKSLDTWSRMTINLPFSKLGLVVGNPIYVDRDATDENLEAVRQTVEHTLNAATERAYGLCGRSHLLTTPFDAVPKTAPPLPIGTRLKAYRGATRALSPLARTVLAYRERQGKEDRTRQAERLGQPNVARPDGPLIWFHAASVGETNVALPVIDAIRAARPDQTVLLTTGTVTSAGLAARRIGPGVIHQYAPIDTPRAVASFFNHWRPELVVLTESEIWPNILIECGERRLPTVLINARMSDRSFKRWRRQRALARQLLSRITLVLAQNERLARRFRWLGARDARPIGNIKIDVPPAPIDEASLAALRGAIGTRPVFLAASTHPGEDAWVIDAHGKLASRHERLLTIIAPRHPERGPAIADQVREAGLTPTQRSTDRLPTADTDVLIADTIGEMSMLYRLAPAAIIGGSMIAHGGQNPVEAIREHCVVLAGPHTKNFEDTYRAIERAGGLVRVGDGAQLADAATRLLGNDVELERHRQAADDALDGLSGALDKTIAALLEMVPEPEEGIRRAS